MRELNDDLTVVIHVTNSDRFTSSSSLEIVCSYPLPASLLLSYLSSSRFFVAGHKADAQQTRFSPLLLLLLLLPALVGSSLINRDAILGRQALSTSPIKRGDVVTGWYIACSAPDSLGIFDRECTRYPESLISPRIISSNVFLTLGKMSLVSWKIVDK